MTRWFCFAVLVGAVLTAAGCGKSGAAKFDVSGTVKYDGQDVEDGFITFVPADASVGPEAGPIKDGKYTAKVVAGKNTVRIQGSRTVPGKKGPMGEDYVGQFIPEKYNDKSELEVEVGVGKTVHNFDLTK